MFWLMFNIYKLLIWKMPEQSMMCAVLILRSRVIFISRLVTPIKERGKIFIMEGFFWQMTPSLRISMSFLDSRYLLRTFCEYLELSLF